MAQLKLDIAGGKPDSEYNFTVRTANDPSTLNRATAFNSATKILVFDEIKDGNSHDYIITVSAPGCQTGTLTVPFQCTDTGACESVKGGAINASSKIAINQPLSLGVTSLTGTTPYTYAWSTTGGTLSSTSTANTTITFSQLDTYTVTLVISNCGNTPITLTKTIEAVLETCDKSTAICYYYGLSNQGAYSNVNAAIAEGCAGKDTYYLGSFSAGLTVGSTVFASPDAGFCTKVAPGFYVLRTSSNGCIRSTDPQALYPSIMQVDASGIIVALHPYTCAIDFSVVSTTQPICNNNTVTEGLLTLNNIKNADSYIICEGSTFNCSMISPTGSITGTNAVIPLPPAISGETKIYTVRLYVKSDTTKFKDVNVTITSPSGCGAKSPTPVLTVAEVSGFPAASLKVTVFLQCLGPIKFYYFNDYTQAYEVAFEEPNPTQLNFTKTYAAPDAVRDGRASTLTATVKCPAFGVDSDMADPILISTTIG